MSKHPDPASRRLDGFSGRVAALGGAVLLSLAAVALARAGDGALARFARLNLAAPWAPPLALPLMFAGLAWATGRWFPESKGSGIPQVIAAAHAAGRHDAPPMVSRLIGLPVAAFKFVATLLLMLSGAAVGREGPTVQICAAVMAATYRALGRQVGAAVIIAGGAAGVSAAFNTPLAGIAFAIEELASAYEQRVALMVMASVMVAGLVSLGISGDYVYFGTVSGTLPLTVMLAAAVISGLVGGVAGGAFSAGLVARAWSRRGPAGWARARPVRWALGCGVVAAAIGWASGMTWGTGYATTRSLLMGGHAPLLMGPLRFVATLVTAVSGVPGGIFAPSLSVGAGLGQFLALAFPAEPSGALVLIGMAGYFTGVVRAPLTSVIIMAEMTNNRTLILPLFVAALIADWASARVCRPKLYHALSRRFKA